jgi:hypothetical protein
MSSNALQFATSIILGAGHEEAIIVAFFKKMLKNIDKGIESLAGISIFAVFAIILLSVLVTLNQCPDASSYNCVPPLFSGPW